MYTWFWVKKKNIWKVKWALSICVCDWARMNTCTHADMI